MKLSHTEKLTKQRAAGVFYLLLITVGHEMVGIVEQVGSAVTKVNPGDRVTVNAETFCNECFFRQNGWVNNCTDENGGWAFGCRRFSFVKFERRKKVRKSQKIIL